jgi:hypothetical protein
MNGNSPRCGIARRISWCSETGRMRKFSKQDCDLLGSLSIPTILVPFLSSWMSALCLGWSLSVLLFTVWRSIASASCMASPTARQGQNADATRRLWSFASATTALQLVPVLWIGALWALQRGTRGLLLFGLSRRVLLWLQSSSLVMVFFWLILFALVAVLLQITRRIYAWHRVATASAIFASGALNPALLRSQRHLVIEKMHSHAN